MAVASSSLRRALIAAFVLLATLAASVTAPSSAAAQEPVAMPVEGFTEPMVISGDFNLSFPVQQTSPNPVQVAPQCFQIEGVGQMCVGQPAVADSPPLEVIGLEELTPLVKDGEAARDALDWIVAEGQESIRATYDIPNDARIGRYARSELRSYILERLLDIMDRKVYGVPLSADEQAALDFVESELLADDLLLAQAAYDEFKHWKDVGCGYHPPAAPDSVATPVALPKKVADWCAVAHHPSAEAFMFAPPMPSVDDFTSWGAYRESEDLGLNALANDTVAANMRDMTLTTVAFAGLAAAIGAAGVTAAIVGTTAALSGAVVALIGSHAAATTWVAGGPAIAGATAGVGAAAAAAVVAVVVVFVVVTAVSIWLLVKNEEIGKTLKTRYDDALKATDPLGLVPLGGSLSGLPLRSEFDPAAPPSYRTAASISKLMAKVGLWTSVNESGAVVADPQGLWDDNATTGKDRKFSQRTGTGDVQTVTSIRVPQDPGYATVRFSRDWMVIDPADEAPKPALSFGYINADGEERIAARAPASLGGFIVTDPAATGAAAGEHVQTISYRNANDRLVRVGIRRRNRDYLDGPRPSAVGPLLAGRAVILRPNPVNLDGTSVDLTEAQTDYTYDWAVTRFNAATGEWNDVPIADAFGPSFVPTSTGSYDARVTMTNIDDSSVVKFGSVAFTIAAPPMTPTTFALLDDGSAQLEVDLQITEPVMDDTITVDVTWPRDFGAGTDPTTTVVLPCFQTGPLECTTSRTGQLDNLIRNLTSATDLRLPVTVTMTNSYGGVTTQQLNIDHPGRPQVAPPEAGVNDGLPGSVLVDETATQVVMPLREGANSTYVAGTLVPGAGGGQDFGLVDPITQNTTANLPIPGLEHVHVSLDERIDGTWELLVFGNPNVRDLGTYEVPIVIQQTNTNRTALVVVLHVVPSVGDRFRAGLQSDVDPDDFAVATLPDLRPVVLGGRTEWAGYRGGMCLSLQRRDFPSDPVVKCGPASTFFTSSGAARRFPYAELFPTGMSSGTYRATAWLTGTGGRVNTEGLGTTFLLQNDASYPPPEVVIGRVSVLGVRAVGRELRGVIDSVHPAGTTLSFRWFRDGVAIGKATGRRYVVRAADAGHRLALRVTATKPDWVTDVRFSALTSVIQP